MSKSIKKSPVMVMRNAKESSDRLVARFNKRVQAARILPAAKERRYWKRPFRKTEIRARAIMRDYFRSLKEKMRYY